MNERVAQALLESVFFRVSALVSMGEREEVLGIKLFSTDWPLGHLRSDQDAHEVWLISNHPDGDPMPYLQDLKNARELACAARCVPVRLFLSSEYFPCFEAEISQM